MGDVLGLYAVCTGTEEKQVNEYFERAVLEVIRKFRLELFRNFRKFALTFQFQRFQNLKRAFASNRNLNFSQRDQCY